MSNSVQQYRVSGECPISVGTGSANALQVLGVSKDGVEINVYEAERAVMSDVGGSEVPVDFQRMGQFAEVRVTLVAWTETVLRALRNRPYVTPGGSTFSPGDGIAVPRGQMIGQAGTAFPLALAAQYEDPWYFYTAKVSKQPQAFKLGTVELEYTLSFYCWVFIPGTLTSLAGLSTGSLPALYDRTIH